MRCDQKKNNVDFIQKHSHRHTQTYIKPNTWALQASLVAQMVKRLPTMQETQVQSLGWEDPLEEHMAIHSSTLAWRIP